MNGGAPQFFALAFAVSWICWLPAVIAGAGADTPWVRWLLYAGIAGPGVAAVVLLYRYGTKVERADFWDRAFEFRRIGPWWLIVILLGYPSVTAIGILVGYALTGRVAETRILDQVVADPATLLSYAALTLLLGPIPEELGWRGYSLDRLRARWAPLTSSLILGAVWAAWHLPEFLIADTYQHRIGIGTPEFGLFVATAIGLSIVMTWLHEATDRSILAAILVHGVVNFTRATVEVPLLADAARTLLLLGCAGAIALWWRGRRAYTR